MLNDTKVIIERFNDKVNISKEGNAILLFNHSDLEISRGVFTGIKITVDSIVKIKYFDLFGNEIARLNKTGFIKLGLTDNKLYNEPIAYLKLYLNEQELNGRIIERS